MPLLRRLLAALSAVLLGGAVLVAGPGVSWAASTSPSSQCSTAFYDGDSRLGPQTFPTRGPVHRELFGYRRFGGETAQQFLATYWDPAAKGWRYPPASGFVVGPGGQPVDWDQTLPVGLDIDRYGSEYGAFLAPEGTLYLQRSIPPQSLDDFDPAYTCNYHDYRVVKAFAVLAGPIAPAFAQPGGGLQFQLQSSLVPGAPSSINVMWLVNNGYLQRLNQPISGRQSMGVERIMVLAG